MTDEKASANNPAPPTVTVGLELPSAQVLADQIATITDLQFVMECCKRLLAELVKPEEEQDPVIPQALWSAALTAYARSFAKGKKFGLTVDDVKALPLEGQVVKFHEWVEGERNIIGRHPTNPFDEARVGAVLAGPGEGHREVRGVTVLSASHILVDGAGVRQLGALASELAKQTAEKAQKQESAVLTDAQHLGLEKLYAMAPLLVGAPTDEDPEDSADSDGQAGSGSESGSGNAG